MFQSNQQRAVAYAAYKELERLLENDGQLPPGFAYNVAGQTVTIQLPNITVQRELGVNKDGMIQKKATQNLYGYATWAFFLKRIAKFNQAHIVRNAIMDALREAVATPPRKDKPNMEAEIEKIDPEIGKFMAQLKKDMPKRDEQTARQVQRLDQSQCLLTFQALQLKEAA